MIRRRLLLPAPLLTLLGLGLVAALAAPTEAAFKQAKCGTVPSGDTLAIAFDNSVAAGSLIIGTVRRASDTATLSSVSDGVNTYSEGDPTSFFGTNTGALRILVAWTRNASAGARTVTMVTTTGGLLYGCVAEFDNVTDAAGDGFHTGTGTATGGDDVTSIQAGAVVVDDLVGDDNYLLVTAIASTADIDFTPDATYTEINTSADRLSMSYRCITNPATYNPTWTFPTATVAAWHGAWLMDSDQSAGGACNASGQGPRRGSLGLMGVGR